MRIVISILLIITFLSGCISSYEDSETAKKVGQCLNETGVVPKDTREADRTHFGKIVYVGPGVNNSPHFTFYEVTSPEDIQKLKHAAEEALLSIPEANKITLHFMEKQVFHETGNGGGFRGKEKEIEKIVVKRK
ncbi:MAG: hypothetical protein HY885_03470 [Deltaproteobacteria bacterium]|nr:hypothetical protein [Deltaproteobacteria bacterium]